MTEFLLTLLALLLAAAGFAIGLLRGRSNWATENARLSALLGEVRAQLALREGELVKLREALTLEKTTVAEADARAAAARENLAEQRRQLEEVDKRLKDAFGAISAAALRNNNEQFITLADARFKPLREQLERYEKQIKELEDARAKAYGGLSQKLDAVQGGADRLSRETSQLIAALRQPGAKGKWGEVTLQRVVELAGLTEHCDFEVQATQDGGLRPDLIVKLPGGRTLAIDSKVNTSAYLDAVSATEETDRRKHLDRYTTALRSTLRTLAGKEYWRQFTPAPEFVVMFMPGEAFFSTAVSHDPDLLADAVRDGVLLASPTTLIALLLAVRHGWQQQQVADNAERIAELGRDLYERLCKFADHLDRLREGLEKANKAYDDAVGNWEKRTLPSAAKLKEFGAAPAGKDIPTLPPIQAHLRQALPPAE